MMTGSGWVLGKAPKRNELHSLPLPEGGGGGYAPVRCGSLFTAIGVRGADK